MVDITKKKVLIFIPEFPRLTETFIKREVAKLIDFGNLDITVFSMTRASGDLPSDIEKVTVFRRMDPITSVLAGFQFFFGSFPQFIRAFRLILGSDRVPFFKRFIYFLKGVAYARLFGKYKPDHIHSHFLSWSSTVAMVAATLLDIPFSVSGHARDVLIEGTLIPAKVRNAKFISICNKHAWRSCIEQSGIDSPENVYQQYHGVDASRLSFSKGDSSEKSRPFIFVGSRLVEKKGLEYVIGASKILKDKGVDHEIHIAGPGHLYDSLISQIDEIGVKDTVIIHGEGKGVSWTEVVEFFKKADVFAHPSVDLDTGDSDGVPTFVIEAALAKVPIVTTDAGSITDLITHEDTGLIVPQKDAHALAEGIQKLISNKDLSRKLSDQAFLQASKMFNLDKNVGALEKLLLKE